MTTYDTALMTGLADLLHAEQLGVWAPDRAYAASETGIVFLSTPQAPDSVITIGTYGVSDDVSEGTATVGVQIRNRAAGTDPRTAHDHAARLFTFLHGRTHLDLSTGLRVAQIYRRSWTSGGQDENRRWSVIQNFYADVYVPEMHVFAPPPEETP